MAKVRLGDIATVVTKGTTPTTMGFQFEDGGINFVKIESISEDGTFLKEKFSHISDECNVQMRRSQLQENDILFSIAGAIGRSAIVTKEILPANTNQALAIIRVPKGKIDYNYLLYALSSSAINQQATQHQQGVAQLNISLKNVSDFLLPIYTEAMQKQIVHNLKKIDKLISLRKQQLAKLDELVKVRFVEMFGDPVLNTKSLLVLMGRDFFKLSNGKAVPDEKRFEMGIPAYGGNGVSWYTDDALLNNDTLVVGRVGFQSGNVHFAKGPLWVTDNAMYINWYDSKKYNLTFLHELMQQIDFSRYQDAGDLKKITQKPFMNFEYIQPPMCQQNEFATFVACVDQQKQTVQQSLEKLELMKKALMQEYFG